MREAAFGVWLRRFLAAGAVVAVCYNFVARWYCAESSVPRVQFGGHIGNRADLLASSDVIDLGVLPQGAHRTEVFSLTNIGRAPVTIERVKTSCDCAVVKVARSTVKPNETTLVSAALDFRHSRDEDNFSGGLSIDVVGVDSSGTEVFAVVLRAQVMEADAFERAIRDDTGNALLAFELGSAP